MLVECAHQDSANRSSGEKQPIRKLYCKLHGREWCTQCCTMEPGHVCNAMVRCCTKVRMYSASVS